MEWFLFVTGALLLSSCALRFAWAQNEAPPKLHHESLRSYLPFLYQETYRPADEILPGLFLGNEAAAADPDFLRAHYIRVIVAMSQEHGPRSPVAERLRLTYEHFGLWDSTVAQSNGGRDAVVETLHAAADRIQQLYETGKGPILVHCQMGISRSTTADRSPECLLCACAGGGVCSE
jgi:hypothetical protein